ncbi:homeobox-leucine zipper protein HDG11-like isoform X2 [Silene latifolia]|uniref:homeobox-leucine zipper protein HDG11-like isoform X2 n=1 Tax=Silene latifolia TaxID=37657 RepID=UPI003D77F2E2
MKPNPELEKLLMIDIAASAMKELIELLTIDQPFWIKSPTEGQYVLDHDSYYKMVARSKGFRNPNPRIESSKDSAVVAMDARLLVDLYLDPDKWVDVFPTFFSKAETISVLKGGLLENRDDSLQLFHEQVHMLSPAMQQRDFYLLRYCRQIETGVWVIADVSYNYFRGASHVSQTFYWKHPSGCMIEEMPNGLSRVTCIERVEVVDDVPVHTMYDDLVNSTLAFGAKRWISTLQRTFERYAFLKEAGIFNDELGIGNESMIILASKLIKSYCSIFSLFGTSDLHQLSELTKNGVHVTSRKNTSPDLPVGIVIIAASSFWVPASPERVFSYLNDHLMRSQWDILCNGSRVCKISQTPTGQHSSNAISVLQPQNLREEFMIFQESVFEQTGSLIVYAPVEMTRMLELATGVDPARVPILASGFAITPDGPDGKDAPSTSTSKPLPAGSLITAAFQILACTALSVDDKDVSTYVFPFADALVNRVVRVIKNVFD